MVDYYGPLVHRAGADTSTVVDPRFGTGAAPTVPAGWATTGGGTSDAAELTGPYADWGLAVNTALASNAVVKVAGGLGALPLRTEIVIPSHRTLEMGSGSWFSITADHVTPTGLSFRRTLHPMIRPAGSSTTWAENIVIRGVTIDGSQSPPRTTSDPYFGIGIIYARNVLVQDCVATDIQYTVAGTSSSYGIGSAEAEHVDFVRCSGWGNGYQNLTAYDGSSHINFTDCYSGNGWRTGFQIHRSVTDVRVVNLVVRNFDPGMHACVTLHGQSDGTAIKRVTFVGLDIEGGTPNPATGRGGVQLVGSTDDLTFIGGRVRSAGTGLYLRGKNIRVVGMDVEAANSAFFMGANDTSSSQGSTAARVSAVGCRFVTASSTVPAVNIAPTYGTVDDVRISDCDIEAAGGTGIALTTDSSGAHLSSNRIKTTGAGMDLTGTGMAYGNDLTGTTGITGGAGFTLANNRT